MKKCPQCNNLNEDDATFCVYCGNELINNEPIVRPVYKRWGFWLIFILFIGGFFLYEVFKPRPATYVKFSVDDGLPFTRLGSDTIVDYDSNGDFDITYYPDWIDVNSDGNNKLKIHCKENNTGADRKGWITIVFGQNKEEINVFQNGSASYLTIDNNTFNIIKSGGSFTVNVKTDGANYVVSDIPDYCAVNKSNESFTVNLGENSSYERSATLTVSSGSQSSELAITQKGICSHCDGTGKVMCGTCYGQKQIFAGYNMVTGSSIYVDCTTCGGTGKVDCNVCNGSGDEP
jgi:hypothetical protein